MRILVEADAVGGVFTYAVELCRALAERGHAVALATQGAPLGDRHRGALEGIPGLTVHESAFRLEWMDDPWDDVAEAGRWLLALERELDPDVVHLDSYAHGALPFRAPRLVVGHSCVLSWFEAVRGEPAPPAWERYQRVVRAGLRAAAAVVAPSRAMLAALVRHYGPLPPAHVIPNGRDPARFPPGEKVPLVAGAGRLWDDAKNAAALAAVAPELPWRVEIAGETREPGRTKTRDDGEGAPALSLAAGRGGARTRAGEGGRERAAGAASEGGGLGGGRPAKLLGMLDDAGIAALLGRASIFAHPARYEPFGLAVLEAALAGCALVLGDIPSLRELWDGAAAFVPPGDRGALAGAIRALAEDAPRRDALAADARARALALGPGRMADRYLDLYRALAARAPE